MDELMTNGSQEPTQLTDKKNKKLQKKSKKTKKNKEKQHPSIQVNPKMIEPVVETTDTPSEKLSKKLYEKELVRLQIELVKMQYWIKQVGLKVIIVFEGRDAAGKGGTIKRITEPLNPRGCRVVALGTPSDQQKTQWYFQRYVEHFPS
jgi:polyphosphate kinase 2 (PPK2 family)